MTQGVGREIAPHFRKEVWFHRDGEARQEVVFLYCAAGEGQERVWLQVLRCGGGHEIGHELGLFHDAVDTLSSIVEQLCGAVDGGVLDKTLAAVEKEVEEQREDHRDNEHDEKTKAQREVLPDILEKSFHEPAGSLMSWSSSWVMASLLFMMSVWREAMSVFESFL